MASIDIFNDMRYNYLMRKDRQIYKKRATWEAKVCLILLIFISLLLLSNMLRGQEYLISDYDFTNQDYTFQRVYRFVRSYKQCDLSYSDVEKVVRFCHIYTVNPVLVIAKMQMESDIIFRNTTNKSLSYLKYRAMAYGMIHHFDRDGKRFCKYGGYDYQVYFAIKTLRKHFDQWDNNTWTTVTDLKRNIMTDNAASHALYRYTPFYGVHDTYNWGMDVMGNEQFVILFNKFKSDWEGIR